jgi:halimadienyl-diphosphate synthase
MDLRQEIYNLLQEIGPGRMMPTVYDTAWVARLAELEEPIAERALEWLRLNQLPDGSWGAKAPCYYHDRTISTLAAINALAQRGETRDQDRLQRAESALEASIDSLKADPAGETVGFELIVPTLLEEAQKLGAIRQDGLDLLRKLNPRRRAKMSALPEKTINRFVTVAFSAEMAGTDGRHLLDIKRLKEINGSVAVSPSATAYFLLYIDRQDSQALDYVREAAPAGKAPNVSPFDVFEQAWALWNLALTEVLDNEMMSLCAKPLDSLESAWKPGSGIGFASEYTPNDGDDTGLVYDVLARFERAVDLDAVLHYEHVYYYKCFDLESTPSVSANIHILGALRQAGLKSQDPLVQKALIFLEHVRSKDAFWIDKWHASPYYPTAHAIVACAGYANELAVNAVRWILDTQNANGSWGYYMPTAEETAYSLQALAIWKREGNSVPDQVIEKGQEWLVNHRESPYPPLWIGKCLYSPELVVESAVLSALALTK